MKMVPRIQKRIIGVYPDVGYAVNHAAMVTVAGFEKPERPSFASGSELEKPRRFLK
jgi:hypothetical protein